VNREWQGDKIGIPAIYKGIPIETYHGDLCVGPSVSSTILRIMMQRSPAHAWAQSIYNPKRIEKKTSEGMIVGKAAHHLLLGEAEFDKFYVERPEEIDGAAWQGNRKVCKQWLKDRAEEGITVLTDSQIERIRGMAEALARHPLIQHGILNGQIERSMIWKDAETGLWVKVRPDAIPTDSLDYSDLKTTTDIGFSEVMKTIGNFGYHQQAALVGEATRVLLKKPMQSFNFVFIESEPPHCVRVVSLKDNAIALGAKMNRAAMQKFAECWEKKSWPGPADDQRDVENIELPEWQVKQMEDMLKYGATA
jgi:hypothetical protein